MKWIFMILLSISICLGCQEKKIEVAVTPTLEEVSADGYPYTPSTQSFLRGHHWLEGIKKATLKVDKNDKATFEFDHNENGKYVKVVNVPLNYLVPRLHYKTKELDEFDLFNLMLSEYSRNGISFPFGREGDNITHFQTNLETAIPWTLAGNYDFVPNPNFKPLRLSVVNNCLAPGLWELNASDKTGEIYHSWFSFPLEDYYALTAKTNNIKVDQVKSALNWSDKEVKLDLDRLRTLKGEIGTEKIELIDEEISYSTQGSRQKLSKGFVAYQDEEGEFVRPSKLSDMLKSKVKMSKFEAPGVYRIKEKMDFDFRIYGKPIGVKVSEVDPLTNYNYDTGKYKRDDLKYIQIEIELPDNKQFILGNLPLNLLVSQEDFAIDGFGVGILAASAFTERRDILLSHGYHPSFAYLAQKTDQGLLGLNSHGEGLEQVFIRSYPHAKQPYWDITFTSYERITDILKYRVYIPQSLIEEQRKHTDEYITPVYFSYRDDNIR